MKKEEVNEILRSSTIKQKLIQRLQELEEIEFKEVDSEEAIVNLALMNFLLDYKFIMAGKGIVEADVLETTDSSEGLNTISKVIKEASTEALLTNLSEMLLDFHEDLNKW